MEIFILILLVIAAFGFLGARANKKRREFLTSKYRDDEIVELIMSKKIRQGMTEEMLIDSWGKPVSIDERVLKTKTKRTYKYHQSGKNQFRSRAIVENGIIVGWDTK